MKKVEIIVCKSCEGSGKTSYEECTDYHKREYQTIYSPCKNCNSTGRQIKTTEVTVKPFK